MSDTALLDDGTRLAASCSCNGMIRRVKTMTRTRILLTGSEWCGESAPREYECAECGSQMRPDAPAPADKGGTGG